MSAPTRGRGAQLDAAQAAPVLALPSLPLVYVNEWQARDVLDLADDAPLPDAETLERQFGIVLVGTIPDPARPRRFDAILRSAFDAGAEYAHDLLRHQAVVDDDSDAAFDAWRRDLAGGDPE